MEENRLVQVLDGIQKAQSEILVAVTEIRGDCKVQRQVLNHHIAQLRVFKVDMEKLIEGVREENHRLEERVQILEKWKLQAVAAGAIVAAVFTLVFDNIKDTLFR